MNIIYLTIELFGGLSVAEIESEATYGPWALHQAYHYPNWWGITHIPTGLTITHFPKPEYEYDAVLRLLYGLPAVNQFATRPPKTIAEAETLRKANDGAAASDDVRCVLKAWRDVYGNWRGS